MASNQLIDLHLCFDGKGCFDLSKLTACADFTTASGACAASAALSSITTLNSDGVTATWTPYLDEACTTRAPYVEQVFRLDGTCVIEEVSPSVLVKAYTATLHGACLPPDPLLPSYFALTDATGHRSGDLGNYDACVENENQHCVLADASGLFIGACVPSACGVSDVTDPLAPIRGYLLGQAPVIALLNASTLTAHCGNNAVPWEAGSYGTVAALSVAALAVLGATLYAALQRVNGDNARRGGAKPPAPRLSAPLNACLRSSALSTTVPRMLGQGSAQRRTQNAHLLAFDGVRVLSLSLVVLGHTLFFPLTLSGFSNGLDIYKSLSGAAFQVFPSAEFAVDTFFLLSGALGALLLTKAMRKALGGGAKRAASSTAQREGLLAGSAGGINNDPATSGDGNSGNIANDIAYADRSALLGPQRSAVPPLARDAASLLYVWLLSIVTRYLRLLPSVAALILVYTYVAPLLGSGPVWSLWEGARKQCTGQAWSQLLFVGNYVPGPSNQVFSSACAGWLWYLSVDMQLHAVALPPLAAAFAVRPSLGWALLAVALIATLAASTVIVVINSLTYQTTLGPPDLAGDYTDLFYSKPLPRAPAFLVGVALGWALLGVGERATAAASAAAKEEGGLEVRGGFDKDDGAGWSRSTQEPRTWATLSQQLLALVLPATSDGLVDGPATALLAAALALLGFLFYVPTSEYAGSLVYFKIAVGDAVPWSTATQQAYTILSRPAWAAGVAALLLLAGTGRAGGLGAVLSLPIWSPLALLSFGAYLYHPVVLFVLSLNITSQPRFSAAYLASNYAATCTYAVLAAAVAYAIVEAPAAALVKCVLGLAGVGGGAQRAQKGRAGGGGGGEE